MKSGYRSYFVWITEYPDDGSLLVTALDRQSAIRAASKDFGEPQTRLSAKLAKRSEIESFGVDYTGY